MDSENIFDPNKAGLFENSFFLGALFKPHFIFQEELSNINITL